MKKRIPSADQFPLPNFKEMEVPELMKSKIFVRSNHAGTKNIFSFFIAMLEGSTAPFFRIRVALFCVLVVSCVNGYGQCSSDYMQMTLSGGTCDSYLSLYVYEPNNPDVDYFTLYKKVNGYWQVVDTQPNDAPPVSFYFYVPENTTFGVSYTTFYGCESSIREVVMTPRPSMPSVTGNRDICFGGSTTLTASGTGVSYRWYDGGTLISGVTGSQFNTGSLTGSKNYSVSTVSSSGCESQKRSVPVTVHNPIAPTPANRSRCGPGVVTLSAPSDFAEYFWYNQNGVLLGSTPNYSLTVSAEGLTSYTVKVKDDNGCWSGMSSSASVTTTHNQLPTVSQNPGCGPNTEVTMHASYDGERAGDYYIEWYTTATGGSPEHSMLVDQ